jgi:tetratricopeptide (TPR) repeat protein
MMPPSKHLLFSTALLFAQLGISEDWTYRDALRPGKTVVNVSGEQSIERTRVRISQNIGWENAPRIRSERVEFDSALRDKRIEKTNELIAQLESLRKRPQQSSRQGEILMRLGEMYFDRSTDVALNESQAWEDDVHQWEKKDPAKRGVRPSLKTPKADKLRRQSLSLYLDLEKRSRSAQASNIRRDEVLFYLGITYMDLRQPKLGVAPLRELISKYPSSPRIFAARLQLADALFDQRVYRDALEQYLLLVSKSSRDVTEPMRAYTLYKMGWCYINLGAYEKAVASFKKTVEISKDSAQSIGFKSEALNDLTRTFALASQYDEGEAYLQNSDGNRNQLLTSFYSQVADLAESRGDVQRSRWAMKKLTELDASPSLKRSLALRELALVRKSGSAADFHKVLREYAQNFGRDSSASAAEQSQIEEELVTLLRSETKAFHNKAQRLKKKSAYEEARPFYSLYFEFVPDRYKDSEKNIHEMSYYFGELLYVLEDFKAASEAYSKVTAGPNQNPAQYARILCLRELAKKDPSLDGKFEEATEAFRKAFPSDGRGADLLYELAYDAYEKKDLKTAERRLLVVLSEYPDNERSKEALERLLFIWEQSGDFDEASAKAKALLGDAKFSKLVKSGSDRRRLEDFSDRAQFKELEAMPNESASDKREKANAYFKLSGQLEGSLKEKALNNALAYADQSKDNELRLVIQQQFLKEFPNSPYIKSIYLKGGELYALQGRFDAARSSYQKYLEIESHQTKDRDPVAVEKARWNLILILGHLENAWAQDPETPHALSKELVAAATQFIREHSKSKFRPRVLELLVSRSGVSAAEIGGYSKLTGLSDLERRTLRFGGILVALRNRDSNSVAAALKNFPAAQAGSWSAFERKVIALAALATVDQARARFGKMKVEYSPERFVPTLQKKFKVLEDLERDTLGVVAYGDGDVALRALTRISENYNELAADLSKASIPKEELASFVDPLREKSKSYIKSCFEKAKEFRISGQGLAECQKRSQSSPTAVLWTAELPRPQPNFVADQVDDRIPMLLKAAHTAAAAKDYGRADLALQLLKLDDENAGGSSLARSLEGVVVWNQGNDNVEALRLFRTAMEEVPAGGKSLALALRRNLAASYFQVADYERAISFAKELGAGDPLAIQIEGLSYLLSGQFAKAEKLFSKASATFKTNREILLYWAIAQGESGNTISATRNLQDYIELTRPSGGHFSRVLYKSWGVKK